MPYYIYPKNLGRLVGALIGSIRNSPYRNKRILVCYCCLWWFFIQWYTGMPFMCRALSCLNANQFQPRPLKRALRVSGYGRLISMPLTHPRTDGGFGGKPAMSSPKISLRNFNRPTLGRVHISRIIKDPVRDVNGKGFDTLHPLGVTYSTGTHNIVYWAHPCFWTIVSSDPEFQHFVICPKLLGPGPMQPKDVVIIAISKATYILDSKQKC